MICDLLTDVSVKGPQTLLKISEQTSLLWEIAAEFSVWQTWKCFQPSLVAHTCILPPTSVTVLTGTPTAPLISPRFYSQVSNSANALVHTPKSTQFTDFFLVYCHWKDRFHKCWHMLDFESPLLRSELNRITCLGIISSALSQCSL